MVFGFSVSGTDVMMTGFRVNTNILYSLAAGLLLALSWPARGFPFLAFFAFIPLFFVEDDLHKRRAGNRSIVFFLHAWVAFFVFNLLTTWWILYATVPGMVVAVILNSVFMAAPWWFMHVSRKVLPGRQGPLSILFLWLGFEFLHARWELSWSWLDMGNVFAAYPKWVQWYEITGTAGGSLWVLVVNLLLFSALANYVKTKSINKKVISAATSAILCFVIPSAISINIWNNYEEEVNPVHVVVIQPSEDPYEPVHSYAEVVRRVDHMIDLADRRITPETRFIVAPEAANPRGIWMHEGEQHYTVQRLREHIIGNPGIVWVLGSFTYRLFDDADKLPAEARPLEQRQAHYVAYNSVVFIEEGRPLQYYHKSKLVPGIERMPYFNWLRPLGWLVDRFGGMAGSLGRQDSRDVYKTKTDQVIGAAVCYESIYGEFMTGYVRDGAGLLFVVTNDGWWRDTPGYRQHNQYARLRALEMRRSIARSASTGISSFINQKGEIMASTSWWEADAMAAELNVNHKMTFFATAGNFIGKMSVFLAALFIMYVISQSLIRKTNRKK